MTNEIFVVAYLSLFDGSIDQKLIFAPSELSALNQYLKTHFLTEEEVYQYCADSDSYISVLQIS